MYSGGMAPPGWGDRSGEMSYECKTCKQWATGPGTSPGLICSYGPSPFDLFVDGNMWCATRPDFINLQESTAGFGPTRPEAIKDCIKNEIAAAKEGK